MGSLDLQGYENNSLGKPFLAGKFQIMRMHSGLYIAGVILLTVIGCTSHPVLSPDPLDVGETYHGMAVSVENVVPQYVFRAGVSPRMDVGVRVGLLPVHGSGLDATYLIRDEGKRLHTLNLAGTYADQSSFEISYINALKKERSKTVRKDGKMYKRIEKYDHNYRYFGLRVAHIPTGYYGDDITLFGFLYGVNFKKEIGLELGYLADFSGREPQSELGLDPLYAPATGLFARIWFGQVFKSDKD